MFFSSFFFSFPFIYHNRKFLGIVLFPPFVSSLDFFSFFSSLSLIPLDYRLFDDLLLSVNLFSSSHLFFNARLSLFLLVVCYIHSLLFFFFCGVE